MIRTALWAAGVALVFLGIFAILRMTKIAEIVVTHDGMAPTLLAGDSAWVWKTQDLEVGDIAVCMNPSGERYEIGRVVAGQADKSLQLKQGNVMVGRKRAEYDFKGRGTFLDLNNDGISVVWGTEKISNTTHLFFDSASRPTELSPRNNNGFFLLGDNRTDAGHDSRTFGSVNAGECLGSVFMRWVAAEREVGFEEIDHSTLDLLD